MGAIYVTEARAYRRCQYALRSEGIHGRTGSQHESHRFGRAYLMEVHLIHAHPMSLRLCLSQQVVDPVSAALGTRSHARSTDGLSDLPQAMMMVMMTLSGTLMLMGGTPVRWLKDPMTHQSFACLREAVFGRTMGAIQ